MKDNSPRKLTDVSHLLNMGRTYNTNLEEGLQKTYEWYIRQN
jgi:GDP-L-fucose synthase